MEIFTFAFINGKMPYSSQRVRVFAINEFHIYAIALIGQNIARQTTTFSNTA
jgi:hypothetical protein